MVANSTITSIQFPSLSGLGCGCEEGDIRLADNSGFSKSSGRVEFCHAGEWGTVCLDGWNSKGTKVVCKQLGLPTNGENYCCIFYSHIHTITHWGVYW